MTHQRDQLLTGLLAVAVTTAFAFAVYVPHRRQIQRFQTEAAALQEEVKRRTGKLQQLQQIQESCRLAEPEAYDFENRIPPTARLGRFLEQIAVVAQRHEVRDPEVEPLHPVGCDAGEVLPVRMQFVSGFASTFGFLQAIESLPRVATVSELHLWVTQRGPDMLNADLTVRIYYQKSPGGTGIGS